MGLYASLGTDWLPDATLFTESGIDYDNDFGGIAASLASQDVPVRTGNLMSSISGDSEEVYAGAEYAQYVEYGTWKMDSQPYFASAVENAALEMGLEWMEQFIEVNQIDAEQYLSQTFHQIETIMAQQLEEAIEEINEYFDNVIAETEAAYAEIPGSAAAEDCAEDVAQLQECRSESIELTTAYVMMIETELKNEVEAQVEMGLAECEGMANNFPSTAVDIAMSSVQII